MSSPVPLTTSVCPVCRQPVRGEFRRDNVGNFYHQNCFDGRTPYPRTWGCTECNQPLGARGNCGTDPQTGETMHNRCIEARRERLRREAERAEREALARSRSNERRQIEIEEQAERTTTEQMIRAIGLMWLTLRMAPSGTFDEGHLKLIEDELRNLGAETGINPFETANGVIWREDDVR